LHSYLLVHAHINICLYVCLYKVALFALPRTDIAPHPQAGRRLHRHPQAALHHPRAHHPVCHQARHLPVPHHPAARRQGNYHAYPVRIMSISV
jgi:hypothetical protein